ncbi:DUF2059 domain-containing protein [Acaryochloris sp. IP29b_bin.148]|uniref:DUF2059 domain-containing protein n=1 Tax=Acaryochloris sp. IP29b_bin.148 TaxID=2969218 RepID=UPI0026037267|nr:DUF2059 domain-containing protein [Acaryochloris sp. IP29b_bin.148]
MLQYSGLRISLVGVVVLTQTTPIIFPRLAAQAEVQPAPSTLPHSAEQPKPIERELEIKDDTPSKTKNVPVVDAPPSPKKMALIRELLQITEQRKNSEQHLEAMLANMEETLPKVLAQIISDRTQLQGDELLKQVTATTQRLVKRYRALLPSRVNIGKVTEDISMNLYAKYYTEKELKDLIKFYQTPTGRKAIATLPQLTKEALEQSNQILLPEITQLLKEIMQEEFGSEPFSPPPGTKTQPSPQSP